jgi:hypothetical protein
MRAQVVQDEMQLLPCRGCLIKAPQESDEFLTAVASSTFADHDTVDDPQGRLVSEAYLRLIDQRRVKWRNHGFRPSDPVSFVVDRRDRTPELDERPARRLVGLDVDEPHVRRQRKRHSHEPVLAQVAVVVRGLAAETCRRTMQRPSTAAVDGRLGHQRQRSTGRWGAGGWQSGYRTHRSRRHRCHRTR